MLIRFPEIFMPISNNGANSGLTAGELRKLRALKNPHGIQKALDSMPYHLENTAWSPRLVLQENTAHCYEGALFAAAALRAIGFPPLVLDLEAVQDTDHVLAVFQMDGHWGAIAKSNYTGYRYREPVYRTLRELALSYFNTYMNLRGERTLRRFSRPVNLKRFDFLQWMISDEPVWCVAEYLTEVPHYPLITQSQAKRLHRVDSRTFRAECMGKAVKK